MQENKLDSNPMKQNIPPKPDRPCTVFGYNDWWWRETAYKPDGWECGHCQPNPNNSCD